MPDGITNRAELVRRLTADRQVLVVFDDVTDAAQIRPLLPGTPTSAVIITSRRRLGDLEGAHHLALDCFSSTEGLELLERMLGAGRVAAEMDAASSVVARCDYLPLAVRIAGAKLAQRPHRSLGWLSGRLDQARSRLETLAAGEMAVRSTLMSAYQALDRQTQLTLRLLALLGLPDCGAWTVAAALDTSLDGATEQLDLLAETSLLQPPHQDRAGQDRFQIHDLVQDFALERAEIEDTPSAMEQRVARAVAEAWLSTAAEN